MAVHKRMTIQKRREERQREFPLCQLKSLHRDSTAQMADNDEEVTCLRCAKALGLELKKAPIDWTAAHSQKALKTFESMGTRPEDWKEADVEWKWESVEIPGWVECPSCTGLRKVVLEYGRRVVPPPPYISGDWRRDHEREQYRREAREPCPECIAKRDNRALGFVAGRSSGKVRGLVRRQMWVGHIQWPPSALFDSRFRPEGDRYCCELCSKTIVYSNRMPAVGKDSQGRWHAMWVGMDCAEKFLPGVHTYVNPDGKKKDFILKG